MKKTVYISEIILQFFIALGAILCGLLMIIKPDGSLMQMPLSMLEGSPFTNFLIPGMILLVVNGFGNLFAGILCLRKHKYAGHVSILFGFGLIIWVFVQVSMIGGGHWLQNLYFGLGLLEVILGIGIREVEKIK